MTLTIEQVILALLGLEAQEKNAAGQDSASLKSGRESPIPEGTDVPDSAAPDSTPQASVSARTEEPKPSDGPARVEPLAVSEEVIQIAKEWSSIIYNEHDCPPGSKLVNYHVIVLARELLRLHEAMRGGK